jgi:urease accessory protein
MYDIQDDNLLQSERIASQIEPSGSWTARLALDFNVSPADERHLLRTRLGFKHFGPLRIQKALYPEGPSPCHAIIVHPPGGIAGGDRLEVSVKSQARSHGLVTTPCAAKWYGTDFMRDASQHVDIALAGKFEWLPQETIVFNRARVRSDIEVRVSAQGAMIGWDHLIFGRHASGETFEQGCFRQSLRIAIDDRVVWHDRLVLHGNDPLFASPIGLRGYHAFATVWAVLPESMHWQESMLQALRDHCAASAGTHTGTSAQESLAWTVLHPRLLVGRVLAHPLNLKVVLHRAWECLRPQVLALPAVAPRLWAT